MVVRVTDISHVGQARRDAASFAEQLKLPEREAAELAIVVTEITTNVVKHAGSGVILMDALGYNGSRGVRVLGLDKGPGIADITKAMRDGYSTSGTAGSGLGAIQRLSATFDLHSLPGYGTAVLADILSNRKASIDASPIEIGVISASVKGEDVCGDGWGLRVLAESAMLMVVDGLGHGPLAAEAAREAERVFQDSQADSPASVLQDVHDSLKSTRGAAMGIASVRPEKGIVSFAGIGNTGATIVGPQISRGMASHNGTIGHQVRAIREFVYPWTAEDHLVMFSDGLSAKWDLKAYPGIWNRHPALIAGVLYRDFSRERDDVTVVVAKNSHKAHNP